MKCNFFSGNVLVVFIVWCSRFSGLHGTPPDPYRQAGEDHGMEDEELDASVCVEVDMKPALSPDTSTTCTGTQKSVLLSYENLWVFWD
jgi:hypothetical protein